MLPSKTWELGLTIVGTGIFLGEGICLFGKRSKLILCCSLSKLSSLGRMLMTLGHGGKIYSPQGYVVKAIYRELQEGYLAMRDNVDCDVLKCIWSCATFMTGIKSLTCYNQCYLIKISINLFFFLKFLYSFKKYYSIGAKFIFYGTIFFNYTYTNNKKKKILWNNIVPTIL